MKVLRDPGTGELYEVLEANLVSTEPYTYETFRRAAATVSLEHREAVKEARACSGRLATAGKDYRMKLAVKVSELRGEGIAATVAEVLAKGSEVVADAAERQDIAAADDRAAMERLRLCRDDRQVLLAMGQWSKSSEQWEA